MSTEIGHLAIQLVGPLQAWGFDSQFSRRNTGLLPTKSAVLGICCAAMGLPKGSDSEIRALEDLRRLRLLVVVVPRSVGVGDRTEQGFPVRRLVDYHTVQNTRTADGGTKGTHLTWRQYIADAAFACVLSGERTKVEAVGSALRNPVWGVWLGRKACIPSAPVFVGVHRSEAEALEKLLGGKPLQMFTHQREVDRFEDGTDTFLDQPLSFGGSTGERAFAPRRVRLTERES